MAQPFIQEEQAQPAAPDIKAQFVQPAVVGNRDDDIRRQEAIDPGEVEEVTGDEQAQYDDFVRRAIAMISDSRQPEDGSPSPSDAVINVMSNSSMSIPQALAEGTVSTVMILHDAAKRAGKEYSPDVIFHGADEVIAGLYMLGSAAGVFSGSSEYSRGSAAQMQQEAQMPAPGAMPTGIEQPQQKMPMGNVPPNGGMEPPNGAEMPSDGDFTDEEYAIMAEAKMLATEMFGRRLLESGQITEDVQREAQSFWDSQIQKEVETGQAEGPMFDSMDVDTIRSKIMKSRGA